MSRLYAELTSDKGGRVLSRADNTSIDVAFRVKNTIIGSVELYVFNDIELGEATDEYLLKFYPQDGGDPHIITQGNL